MIKKLMILLCLFLIVTFRSNAQDTTIVRDSILCQAFWQIFENDNSLFYFENNNRRTTDFQTIISYIDTLANDIVETENFDFQTDGYLIQKHHFSHNDISKMLFINQQKRIEKIGFYIFIYDNNGNYLNEQLLFWAIYK